MICSKNGHSIGNSSQVKTSKGSCLRGAASPGVSGSSASFVVVDVGLGVQGVSAQGFRSSSQLQKVPGKLVCLSGHKNCGIYTLVSKHHDIAP